MATDPPRSSDLGLVVLLLADLRGYTAFTHERGDEAAARLAERFASLARETAEAYGGRVVEVRGDEALAVFHSARQALRAAVALQARCAEEASADLPLRVGIGLDAGEPVQVEGGYRGEVLNVAARLCALAGPGEVLASESVIHLARRIEGLEYADRGAVELKGLPEPLRVVEVHAERGPARPDDGQAHAPESTAPAGPAGQRRHNLPGQLTTFIDREQEIAEVRRILGSTRLLTLTGTGGCGKTRLALQVASRLVSEYRDGVWLVELASLSDPALVPVAVAAALGVREEPERPLLATLVSALRARSLLLLLDNCEHLVAACAALADDLLRACPGLKILATSRQALGIAGETTWRVPSLPLPDPRRLPPVERLTEYAGVRLFVDRARAARPDFTLTSENARASVELCLRLDGLPLALELAAPRIKVLSIEQIAERLGDRFRLLSGGSRTALPRQQTLRATVDWSYSLLEPGERRLFDRLAVFAGGWTLDAAEAVCAGDGLASDDVLGLLAQLVDKSLVVPEANAAGAVRYRLLETLREYAAEQLAASGAMEATARRHAEYYLRLAGQAETELSGPRQEAWFDRLEREQDNLRTALRWYRERDPEAGLGLAGGLARFWRVRGAYTEGRRWLEELLALTSGQTGVRARALLGVGVLALEQGDASAASAALGQSLAIFRELGDTAGAAAALDRLGWMAREQGDFERARSLYEEALTLFRAVGASSGIAGTLSVLGDIAFAQRDYDRAKRLWEEGLAASREVGDSREIGFALGYLANLARLQGDLHRARSLFEDSAASFRRIGERRGMSWALANLGNLARLQGDRRRAAELLAESLTLAREIARSEPFLVARLYFPGLLAMQPGTYAAGVRLLAAATALDRLPLSRRLDPDELADCEGSLAQARTALGDDAYARAWADGAALTLDQAIAAALEVVQAIGAEPDQA